MAGKSSNFGTLLTTVGLSMATIAAFVAFAIFYGKYSDEKQKLAQAQKDSEAIVRPGEANQDTIRVLTDAARKENKSLVKYLADQRDALTQRVTGDKRDSLTSIDQKLQGLDGSDQPILTQLTNATAKAAGATTTAQQAEAARQQAIADLNNELARLGAIEKSHRETIAAINTDVTKYKDEIELYRSGADDYKKATAAQLERARSEASETEKRLSDQLSRVTEQKLILEAQIAKLRNDRSGQLFKGQDEAALVDARVIGVNEVDRSVVVNIGRKQHAVLGMTFAVYTAPEAIKPDDAGVYSPGKATLEIVNVGDTSSTCRVTSELRGNPVVKGDVCANAVYDPNKVYKFVVYGSFDTDRDGLATPVERTEMEDTIRAWGGDIVADLSGDVDFVVLGERPTLPPQPAEDAPLAISLEFKSRVAELERYDALFKQGTSTGVPVLNENRLYTLIGRTPAPATRAYRASGSRQ